MDVYNQTIDGEIACAITAAVGGQTQVERKSSCTLKIRGGCEKDCYGKKAGKGALVQTEKSATLGVSQDQTLIQIEE